MTGEVGVCAFANECWHINVKLTGAPNGHQILYIHTGDSHIAFPCSFGDTSRCACLNNIVSAYSLTSIGDVDAACATASDSPTISSALYDADSTAVDEVSVQVSDSGFTIVISDAALESLGAITSGSGVDVTAELHVGFAELSPVAALDFYDPVAHEAKLNLQKSFVATFSSASAQESSALGYFAARVHKVTSPNGDKYYAAVTFVLSSSGRRGSITDIEIPVSSIAVTDGSGAAIAVDCDSESGAFTGNTQDFTAACGPFPGDNSIPFCSGQLHTFGEADGLASVFIPLASAPGSGVLTVEFVALANGTGAPVLQTLQVGIDVDSGVVEWCKPAEKKKKVAKIIARVPLSKEEFQQLEATYRAALANTLGVPADSVKVVRTTRVNLRRRTLLAEGVEVETEVVLEPEEEGSALAILSNATTLAQSFSEELAAVNATALGAVFEEVTLTEREPNEVRTSVDLVAETDLDVGIYAGILLESESAGFPGSLLPLGSEVAPRLPEPRATLLDGVITVAASYKKPAPNTDPADDITDGTVLDVELVRLVAVFLADPAPNADLTSRIVLPVASYSPATGGMTFDTSGVCVDGPAECEVKTLVKGAALQGDDDSDGSTPEALALHQASDTAAGAWLQTVAGSGNDWIAAQGRHFRSQVAAAWDPARSNQAFWVSPRREAVPTPAEVRTRVSAAVVVFAV